MTGRPTCVYCGCPLGFTIGREHGKRGRGGRGLFCSALCAEEWAHLALTGLASPRGTSHEPNGARHLPPAPPLDER